MRTLYCTLALCAAVALATPARAQGVLPLDVDVASAYDALAATAARDGSVRVIVNLDIRFVPEGDLSAPAAQSQRTDIARAQAAVLAALSAPENVKRFRFTPAFAATLHAADLNKLRTLAEVSWVQEDVPVEAHDLGLEPAALRLDDSTVLVGATAAHTAGIDGAGYEVAILDTGVQSDHPFLNGQVVAEACFSTTNASSASTTLCPDGQEEQVGPGAGANCDASLWSAGCDHGTHVAGIAAGDQSGATGPAVGVAPGAGVVAIQVFSGFSAAQPACDGSPCVLTYSSDQILGLEHVYDLVVNGGRNIVAANMSLGGGQFFGTCDTDTRKTVIDNLLSVGVSTVISSGNNGYQSSTGAPACISSAVTVGSSTKTDGVSGFSNIAPWMDLFAPGSAIISSVPTNGYASYNGTSMAAPHVAGAFALMQDRFPSATPADLLQRLVTSGVPLLAGSPAATYPRIQVDAAFNDPPELDYTPASLAVTLAPDEEATRTVTLSNTAAPGSVALAYSARLDNVLDETGNPVSNACTANQTLTQGSASFYTNNTPGGFESGQSFVVTCTGTMVSIAPYVYGQIAPGVAWTGTLRVYEGAGTGGTELDAIPVSSTTSETSGYLPISLTTPIDVEVGETYTWFLDMTGSNPVPLLGSSSNPYAGGDRYRTSDGNPANATVRTTDDMQFQITFGAPALWASVSPTSGAIPAGDSEDLTVGFDATGYPAGTFTADLVITSNDEDEGTVTIPVAMVVSEDDGTISLVVAGSRGMRYLGAPANGVTVDDLAGQNLVRGVPGYYPAADPPNLWTSYDAVGAEWVVSTGTGEVLNPGQAFRWRMYDRNVGNPDVSRSVELPFTLSTALPANTADVTVELQTGGSRFNYLANPFGEPLDVTGVFTWPGGDNVAPIFGVEVFDEVAAAWATPSGPVAPWEAFRVRAKGPTVSGDPRTLTIPYPAAPAAISARETAEALASVDRDAGITRLPFVLAGRTADGAPLAGSFAVAFADGARAALDEADAPATAPLAEAYAVVGARVGGQLVGLDARPFAAGEVPLALDVRGAARTMTLRWDASALPAGPPVVLVDLATGAETDVRTRSSYAFDVAPRAALSEDDVLGAGELADPAGATDRFVLRIGAALADAEAVEALELTSVAPNPSSSTARVSFAVPASGRARVSVVDVRGREVAVLVDGVVGAGRHEAALDASGLAAGVYLVRLEAEGQVVTRQAAVVR